MTDKSKINALDFADIEKQWTQGNYAEKVKLQKGGAGVKGSLEWLMSPVKDMDETPAECFAIKASLALRTILYPVRYLCTGKTAKSPDAPVSGQPNQYVSTEREFMPEMSPVEFAKISEDHKEKRVQNCGMPYSKVNFRCMKRAGWLLIRFCKSEVVAKDARDAWLVLWGTRNGDITDGKATGNAESLKFMNLDVKSWKLEVKSLKGVKITGRGALAKIFVDDLINEF